MKRRKPHPRWTDRLYPQPVDPVKVREEAEGLQAGLAGEPLDPSKSDAWKRGHQVGTYRREADNK